MAPAAPRTSRTLAAIAVTLVLAALVMGALRSERPPRPVAATAPATEFSAERAKAHLDVIAQTPRRSGSAAHARARDYLIATLRALGWDVAVQEAAVVQLRYSRPVDDRPARVATVQNVVARANGTSDSRDAVLLMAHYDSRSMTPGASDDGYGTATLLETARALKASAPLLHDVVLVFTDGEEEGLLGAKAFVAEHPFAKDARVVLNFEARGNTGSVLMFQTSDGNDDLIDALARAAPHPQASSLSRAIYKRMPNDTDFTEWLPTHVSGMNFANVEGLDRYHAPTDTVANADLSTIQHHGSYALALARHFGAARELPAVGAARSDATFFNAGPLLVHYPLSWALPVALLAVVAFFLFVLHAARRGAIRLRGSIVAGGATLVAIVLATFACGGAWSVVSSSNADYTLMRAASSAMQGRYAWAFVALAIAVTLGALAFAERYARVAETLVGGGTVWAILALTSAVYLPEAACLFAWPLLTSSLAGLALVVLGRGEEESWVTTAAQGAAAAVPIVLLAPIVELLFAAFGPAAAAGIGAVVALTLVLIAPALRVVLAWAGWIAPGASLAASLLLFVVAARTPPFDAANPKPGTLFAAADVDSRTSVVAVPRTGRDEWSDRVLGGSAKESVLPTFFPLGVEAPLLIADVPFADRDAARADVVEDGRSGASPSMVLRVVPPEDAEVLAVYITADIAGALVQGKDVPLMKRGGVAFEYTAPPADGILVSLRMSTASPVKVRVVAQKAGLPPEVVKVVGTRPESAMPKSGTLPPWSELQESDMTLVTMEVTR